MKKAFFYTLIALGVLLILSAIVVRLNKPCSAYTNYPSYEIPSKCNKYFGIEK